MIRYKHEGAFEARSEDHWYCNAPYLGKREIWGDEMKWKIDESVLWGCFSFSFCCCMVVSEYGIVRCVGAWNCGIGGLLDQKVQVSV